MNIKIACLASGILARTVLPAGAAAPRVEIDFGGQTIRGDTHSSKFEEYREVPRGFYVEGLCLDLSSSAYYLRLDGTKPGLADQNFRLETGTWGRHKVGVSYNQTPHNYSNTAQTYLVEQGDGIFTLPDAMQTSLQTSTANSTGFLLNSPFVPLRVDRKQGSLTYAFSPAGKWRFNLGFITEKREGHKNIGVTYGHGQVQEALEPVRYNTHDLSLSTERIGDIVSWSAGYQLSLFENSLQSLTVDNPYRLADAAVSASGASASGRAQLALAPDNQNHQANLSMAVKTSANSRLNTNFGYALQMQDENFLPMTANRNLLASPALQAAPAKNLSGVVHTLNATARWHWRPLDGLTAVLNGRHYNMDNQTPSLLFAQYVPYDASLSTGVPTKSYNPTRSRRSLPVSYGKTNLGADLRYKLAQALSLTAGYAWEKIGRNHRETDSTKEDIFKTGANLGPIAGVTLRPSYQYARRTAQGYSSHRQAEEAYPLGEGTALGQFEELRKYDQAGRRRHNVTVRAEWDALDQVAAGFDYGYLRDDYDANYGVLDSESVNYSADVTVTPVEGWSVFADYTCEDMVSNALSRYRATGVDTPRNDWWSRFRDTVHTVNIGTKGEVIRDVLDLEADWSSSQSKGTQRSWNTGNITTASALATDLPGTYTRLNKVRAQARYQLLAGLAAKAGYEFSRYTETDWSQDDLEVYQKNWQNSVFLGATQPGYEAHLISMGFSYAY